MSHIDYFIDPVLRAPTIGSMLMCFSAALLGVLVFIRRQSLLGETLSHATYPGVTFAIMFTSLFQSEGWAAFFVLLSAFVSSLSGLGVLHYLQSKLRISPDASLCAVLVSFFGIGITIASRVQFTHTHAFRQIQTYLYGQAATMTDFHIVLYGGFALCVIFFCLLFYKELQIISFDRQFARSMGIPMIAVESIFFILMGLSIVIGIRSVGVVLMSAMLIAPSVAARQLSSRLSILFLLAGTIGLISGFLGNYLSVALSRSLSAQSPDWRASLPTGPMIVLVASSIAMVSLLFAPERGLLVRYVRIGLFQFKRRQENLIKVLWRKASQQEAFIPVSEIEFPPFALRFFLYYFRIKGWVTFPQKGQCALTKRGKAIGNKIVRLHRLWEVYLVSFLGEGIDRVHRSAEEMEHILTPELEKQLTELLKDPLHDPHAQPIPPYEEGDGVMTHG